MQKPMLRNLISSHNTLKNILNGKEIKKLEQIAEKQTLLTQQDVK